MLSLWIWVASAGCASGFVASAQLAPTAPADSIDSVVFLVGDAGGPVSASTPVMDALAAEVAGAPRLSTVVFLGDNVYPRFPDSASPDRAEAERRLAVQLATVRGGARGIVIPGNHEWSGEDGWDAVRHQGQFIGAGFPDVSFLPGDGCPGPSTVDVGRRLRLVLLDTQWWLEGGAKPSDPTSSCPADSPAEIETGLRTALREAGGRQVAVVAHHPLASGGPHGGHFTWRDHIFPLTAMVPWLWLPLPVIGSAYPLARRSGLSPQDASSSENRLMRQSIERAIAEFKPLVYVSGHEHSMEVRDGVAAKYLLVSGSGYYGHSVAVKRSPATRFTIRRAGFMKLEALVSGRVRLSVVTVSRQARAEEVFSMWLDR